jgi:2-dehydro-3-deoxy-D-arabinonate dehydratase
MKITALGIYLSQPIRNWLVVVFSSLRDSPIHWHAQKIINQELTVKLSRLQISTGIRWAVDDHILPETFTLSSLLQQPASAMPGFLNQQVTSTPAQGQPLAPLEPDQEVWASGVTFLRSREAREAESAAGDVYQQVYTAERPELFFKAAGWRVIKTDGEIRVRGDSRWNVPEPELTLLLNSAGEICGYCAGNDVSSRDIEGENPLYLPQAKVYNGSCALGPSLVLTSDVDALRDLPIRLEISRGGETVFSGETSTKMMKRRLEELAAFLFRELDFPKGALLMTGTGIVPPEEFTLQPGDNVLVCVGDLRLTNKTAS